MANPESVMVELMKCGEKLRQIFAHPESLAYPRVFINGHLASNIQSIEKDMRYITTLHDIEIEEEESKQAEMKIAEQQRKLALAKTNRKRKLEELEAGLEYYVMKE